MLKQVSVQEIKDLRVRREHGRLVVVTRYYPRYLKRKLIEEYLPDLAPPKELLTLFKETEKELQDHNLAFEKMEYQKKFELNEHGHRELVRLTVLSETDDVFLICHCTKDQYCHRELLLILAAELYGAKVGRLSHSYDDFIFRLRSSLTSST